MQSLSAAGEDHISEKNLNPHERRTEKEEIQVGEYYAGAKRYYDQNAELTVVKLYSGDYYVTNKPREMIVTILGSCVAACIRDPVAKVGGMNHFLLPGDTSYQQEEESTRYGAFAMEQLINELLKLGALKSRLEVKVFGGGNVIDNSAMIGEKNARFVRSFLKDEGLKIVAEDLEGNMPRRVHYYPDTGKVMMRKLHRRDDTRIINEETKFKKQLQSHLPGGTVELFG